MGAREAAKPKLAGRVEVDDAYLGGERPGGKRGRGAAGKTPIVAAVETTAERRPRRLRLSVVKGFRKKEVERLAERTSPPAAMSSATACPAGRRSRRPAASTSRWRPVPASGPRAGRRSSGSTPAWATSRPRSPAPTTTSARSMRSPTSPASPTASIAASSSTASSSASPGPPSIPARSPTGVIVSDA